MQYEHKIIVCTTYCLMLIVHHDILNMYELKRNLI